MNQDQNFTEKSSKSHLPKVTVLIWHLTPNIRTFQTIKEPTESLFITVFMW